jgi:hypothetical protein
MQKKASRIILPIMVIALALIMTGCDAKLFSKTKKITPDAAKAKVEDFINKNLMAPGTKAQIEKVTEENGLYKMSVNIGQGQVIDSYATMDGEKFFPNAIDVKEATSTDATTGDQAAATNDQANAQPTPTNAPKTAKPKVELFVMSHCPYGTQIEKGMLPVVKALGSKIDFQIKFCDYAMHGEKELKEQLNQYCIQKEQTAKFQAYLTCFLEASDTEGCITKAGVDKKKMTACADKTDKQFNVMAQTEKKGTFPAFNVFKDDNAKYNVGGSPTLIINGADIQSGRDANSLLAAICGAFDKKPKECDTKLSTETPAAGFGGGSAPAAAGNAGCATN